MYRLEIYAEQIYCQNHFLGFFTNARIISASVLQQLTHNKFFIVKPPSILDIPTSKASHNLCDIICVSICKNNASASLKILRSFLLMRRVIANFFILGNIDLLFSRAVFSQSKAKNRFRNMKIIKGEFQGICFKAHPVIEFQPKLEIKSDFST